MKTTKWLFCVPLFALFLSGCFSSPGINSNSNNNDNQSQNNDDNHDQQPEYVTAIWLNNNGEELYREELEKGHTPSYPYKNPQYVEADNEENNYVRTFIGWSPEMGPITQNTTYTAQYESKRRSGIQDGLFWVTTYEFDSEGKEVILEYASVIGFDYRYENKSITIPATIEGLPVLEVRDIEKSSRGTNKNVEEIVIHHQVREVDLGTYSTIKKVTIDKTPKQFNIAYDVLLETNTYSHASYVGNEDNPYLICMGPLGDLEDGVLNLHPDCELVSFRSLSHFTNWRKCRVINAGSKVQNFDFNGNSIDVYEERIPGLNLEAINIDANNETYQSVDGVLYSKDLKHAVYCPYGKKGQLDIPSGVEYIDDYFGDYAYYITNINLPETLKEIGRLAFNYCYSVRTLYLPDSVETVKELGFSGGLELLRLGKSFKGVYIDYGHHPVTILNESDIEPDGNLHSWEIISTMDESRVYEKGGYKLIDYKYNNERMRSVVIGLAGEPTKFDFSRDSLEDLENNSSYYVEVKDYAFAGYGFLKEVTVSIDFRAAFMEIGNVKAPFAFCPNLKKVTLNSSSIDLSNMVALEDLTINYWTDNIVTKNCPNIRTISTTESDYYYIENEALITNKENRLVLATNQTTKIPDNVESIGKNAFAYRKDLEEIVIPSKVTSIDEGAFNGCENLTTADVASENVGKSAFASCLSLHNLTLRNTVKEIDEGAFSFCMSLTKAEVPSSTKIDNVIFARCYNMEELYLPETIMNWYDKPQNMRKLQYEVEDGIRYLGSKANKYLVACDMENPQQENVKFKEGCRLIIKEVFSKSYGRDYDNNNLKTIEFPSSLLVMNAQTYLCNNLTSITFKENTNPLTFGQNSFRDCFKLTSITGLPDTIDNVGNSSFCGIGVEYTEYENGYYLGNENNPYLIMIEYIGEATTPIISDRCRIVIGEDEWSRFTAHSPLDGVSEHLIIPDSVIRFNAYFHNYGHRRFKEITLGEKLKTCVASSEFDIVHLNSISLEEGNFYSVKQFTVGDKVKDIPSDFIGNYEFEEINFPDSVETIGDHAFYYGEKFMKVRIGKGMKNLGNVPFWGNVYELINESSLRFTYDDELGLYVGPNGITAEHVANSAAQSKLRKYDNQYIYDRHTLVKAIFTSDTYVIPDIITKIDYEAFNYDQKIEATHLVIPTSILELDGYYIGFTEITYKGTKEQFNALRYVGDDFDALKSCFRFVKIVHCSDGDINV